MKSRNFGKEIWIEFVTAFLICTAGICMLEGIMGMMFFPEERFGYEAFFSPPLFAFFSVGFGLVTRSRKELSIRQVIARHILHLALIEAFVFGVNYLSGVLFSWKIGIALALAIAIIFAMVYTVMYMNDRKSAALFNEKLKQYQEDAANREG